MAHVDIDDLPAKSCIVYRARYTALRHEEFLHLLYFLVQIRRSTPRAASSCSVADLSGGERRRVAQQVGVLATPAAAGSVPRLICAGLCGLAGRSEQPNGQARGITRADRSLTYCLCLV